MKRSKKSPKTRRLEKNRDNGLDGIERQIRENELKWQSGWRRILDKFLTPATFGVIAIIVGTVITYQNWKAEKEEESIIQLQRQLLIPSLAASATEALIDKGDKGYRALWLFLSSADSLSIDTQTLVVDVLANLSKSTKNIEIIAKVLSPLLGNEGSRRRGQTDRKSLVFINKVYNSYFDFIKSNSLSNRDLQTFEWQFFEWERQWHLSLADADRESNSVSNNPVYIPAGYFFDSNDRLNYLDEFWVRFPQISKKDSSFLHEVLDSLRIDDEVKLDRKNEQEFKKIGAAMIRRIKLIEQANLGKWTGAHGPSRIQGGVQVEINFAPVVNFIKREQGILIDKPESELMQWKYGHGMLGTRRAHFFPYSPESFHRITYTVNENGTSRLQLPRY